MRDPILAVHVVAGAAGLGLGPLVLPGLVRGEPRGSGQLAYQAAIAVTVATAISVAALEWSRLWWLALIALAVQTAALGGLWMARARPAGWRGWRVRFLWGSYVGLITALLVVSWGSALAWVLPSALGVPVVERAAFLADRPRPAR